jgi:hypothetical protein
MPIVISQDNWVHNQHTLQGEFSEYLQRVIDWYRRHVGYEEVREQYMGFVFPHDPSPDTHCVLCGVELVPDEFAINIRVFGTNRHVPRTTRCFECVEDAYLGHGPGTLVDNQMHFLDPFRVDPR